MRKFISQNTAQRCWGMMFLLFFCAALTITAQDDNNLSYFYLGKDKTYFEIRDSDNYILPVPGKVMLKKSSLLFKNEFEEIIKNTCPVEEINWLNEDICTIIIKEEKVDKAIESLLEDHRVLSAHRKYQMPNTGGEEWGYSDKLEIRFYSDVPEEIQDKVLSKYGISVPRTDKLWVKANCFYATLPKGYDIFAVSRDLYETGLFEYASPMFVARAERFDMTPIYPNDPYFIYQRSLHNIGQTVNGYIGTVDADIDAPEAWGITMGSPDIMVAVIDDGVSANHPDLPSSRQVRLPGSNFGAGDPDDPSPQGNDNHGNACAGTIAASINNNEGIVGVAPECKIMPIRWDDTTLVDSMSYAIIFAVDNGARVISCSWGYSIMQIPEGNLYSSIEYAIRQGVVVVFAAGNNARNQFHQDGYVAFPARCQIDNMLCVGASDRDDFQADYSPTSHLIDIVAPSHKAFMSTEIPDIWALDQPGSTGHNPWPSDASDVGVPAGEELPNSGSNSNYLAYTAHFGGTSHACPVVAGVAALLLSEDPTLTPEQVYSVITSTADKIGPYDYSDNGKSIQAGYGRVNAFNALSSICTHRVITQEVNNNISVSSCEVVIEDTDIENDGFLKIKHRKFTQINGETVVDVGGRLFIK